MGQHRLTEFVHILACSELYCVYVYVMREDLHIHAVDMHT